MSKETAPNNLGKLETFIRDNAEKMGQIVNPYDLATGRERKNWVTYKLLSVLEIDEEGNGEFEFDQLNVIERDQICNISDLKYYIYVASTAEILSKGGH